MNHYLCKLGLHRFVKYFWYCWYRECERCGLHERRTYDGTTYSWQRALRPDKNTG